MFHDDNRLALAAILEACDPAYQQAQQEKKAAAAAAEAARAAKGKTTSSSRGMAPTRATLPLEPIRARTRTEPARSPPLSVLPRQDLQLFDNLYDSAAVLREVLVDFVKRGSWICIAAPKDRAGKHNVPEGSGLYAVQGRDGGFIARNCLTPVELFARFWRKHGALDVASIASTYWTQFVPMQVDMAKKPLQQKRLPAVVLTPEQAAAVNWVMANAIVREKLPNKKLSDKSSVLLTNLYYCRASHGNTVARACPPVLPCVTCTQ